MWQFICDHIEEEVGLIINTPILSFTALIVVITFVWIALRWRYGREIDLKKQSISSLGQQISFLKDKLEYPTSEKPKRKSALPPPSTKIQHSKIKPLSKGDEKERILSAFKKVDVERSQLKPEDFFSSILPGQSKGEKIIKQYNDLKSQLEKLDSTP